MGFLNKWSLPTLNESDKNQLHCGFLTLEVIKVIIVPFLATKYWSQSTSFFKLFWAKYLKYFFHCFMAL